MTERKDIHLFTEAELISKVVVFDDHLAFGEIVNRYQNDVRNLLLKLLNFNEQEVDDLYQDVFIKIYKNLTSFKGKSAFSTWVYQITYRTFLDDITRKGKYKAHENNSTLAKSTVAHSNVSNMLDAERIVMCLEPEEKAAIQLSYMNGLSHKEIAKVLDCSIGVVKGHIAKGKKRIREIYNNDYEK